MLVRIPYLQNDVANIYVKIGLVNNALDIYLHLKKWSDVIACYQIMKKLSLVNALVAAREKHRTILKFHSGRTCDT